MTATTSETSAMTQPESPRVRRERLTARYNELVSLRQLAKDEGISGSRLQREFRAWGVPLRDRREARVAFLEHGKRAE